MHGNMHVTMAVCIYVVVLQQRQIQIYVLGFTLQTSGIVGVIGSTVYIRRSGCFEDFSPPNDRWDMVFQTATITS
jgi:hypothetical protein